MSAATDIAEWAKAHQACFEAEPIIEMKDSAKQSAESSKRSVSRIAT